MPVFLDEKDSRKDFIGEQLKKLIVVCQNLWLMFICLLNLDGNMEMK